MPAYSKRVRQIVRQSSYFTRVSALYVRNKLDTKVFNFKRHLHLPVCRRCCMLDCTALHEGSFVFRLLTFVVSRLTIDDKRSER